MYMNTVYLGIVKTAPLHAKVSWLWLWSSSECPRDVFCMDQVAVRAVWRSSQQVVLALAVWKLGVPKCDQTKWCTVKDMHSIMIYNMHKHTTHIDNVFKRLIYVCVHITCLYIWFRVPCCQSPPPHGMGPKPTFWLHFHGTRQNTWYLQCFDKLGLRNCGICSVL